MSESTTPKGTNVQVAVRCRPPNEEERNGSHATVVSCNQQAKQVSVSSGLKNKSKKTFSFDKVFGMYSTQEEVFDTMVQPIVEETLAGFNCTIFAYGQTGTGKTHTMEGDIHCADNAGIVPRAVRKIIEELESRNADFNMRVSFLELYNEELQDLLSTEASMKDKGPLRLCEDVKKGVVCQNLEEINVADVNAIFDILKRGIKQRQTAATLCNKNSSRSHSIFTMKIMIRETNVEGEEIVRNGQLNLVDLAGSECVGRSGAKNARAREAGSINQSLLTLGRVITALVDHHGHIPYRDSKLTRLLQESLGGKAKTCIIATLSPSQLAVEETLSTLDYASKAKSIKNIPQVNQKLSKKTVMKEYCAEIETLRNLLQITREKNGIYLDPATYENMEARLASQDNQITECEAALQMRNVEIKSMKVDLDAVKEQYEESQFVLIAKTEKLEETEKNLKLKTEESNNFQIEWQASESVVSQQGVTESNLASHCAELQENVTNCNDDITGLFGKIDRHANKEKERIALTENFSAEMASQHSALLNSMAQTLNESQAQSQELCNGVGSILAKGKNVCLEFEESIEKALVVLVGDTTVAKDEMVESCSSLSGTLNGTQTEVIDSLKALKQNLSTWLGEVQTNMDNTQSVLSHQRTSLEELQGAIESSDNNFKVKNEEFVQAQKDFSSNLVSDMSQLKNDISDSISTFRNEIQQNAEKSKAEMNSKSEALQKTMKNLLQDLVDTQNSHTDKVVMDTDTYSTAVSTSTHECIGNLINATNSANESILQLNGAIANDITQSNLQFKSIVDGTHETRKEIENEISIVASTVGDKRAFLDETTKELSSSVTQSISSAQERVQQTSRTAERMVDNVTDASKKMKTSCSDSMNSFTEFLGGKGEEINSELINHFDTLKNKLSTDVNILNTASSTNSVFLENTRAGVLHPTGTTPTKKGPFPLQPIERTRPHDDIKNETRAEFSKKLQESQEVTEDITTNESFMSPSKSARMSELKEKVPIVVDSENIIPSNSLSINLHDSSMDDDDDHSITSKGSVQSALSSTSTSSSSSRGIKRAASGKLGSPKPKKVTSKIARGSSARSVL